MKKIISIAFTMVFVSAVFFNPTSVEAQTAKKGEVELYNLKVKYPLKVYTKVKYSDSTNVIRTYSDGSQKEYTREVVFYFTQFTPDPPKDGFVTVNMTIDSMRYKFTEGKAVYEFDSQKDEIPSTSFFDMTVNSVSLGKSFDITYSPYGESVKLEGESIDKLVDYVTVEGAKILDTLKKYVWVHGVSRSHLEHITDLQKAMIPYKKVAMDSSWTGNFFVEIDGIDFADSLRATLTKYNAGVYEIRSQTRDMQPEPGQYQLYGIKEFVTIESGKASGNYELDLYATGRVKSISAEFNADVKAIVKKEHFSQKIHSKFKWENLGEFKFK